MTTRKYKTNIFVKTTVWILVFSFVYGNVQTGYSSELDSSVEKYTLAPNTFQDDLAEYGKKQPGRLERVYRRFRSLFGKVDLSGWLPLGLVGALFRDYVSSLPEEEKTGYRRQYADFVKDIKGFSRLLSKVTGDGNKIAPIRIDTVISLQRQDVSYGVNELIANGIDGVLKDRGMWRHLIGQFGEGFFLILKELEEEESSDPNDRIVLTTSVDGKTALRTEFRRVGENYYMRFEVIDKNVRKGTHIRVYKSNFSFEIVEDGKIITRQELRNRKIAEAFSYNLSLPIILNGRRRHVNSLDNFSGMEELFGTEPQYLVEDDCIKINVYKDGYEVSDNGCGIDLLTYFEQLLVPRSSSHEEERPVKKHDYTSSELREEIRFFYRLPEEPEIVIETEVVLQVSGVCIERFKVNGINIPERMVLELPRWTSVGGEGRNKIKMDDLTIKAFKYIVDKVLELKEGTEQDILLNGIAGVLREKQRIDKETGMVRPEDDLLQYIYNKAKKRNERFSGEMVLPNQAEFLCFIPPERYTKRYLDKDTFLFDPRITPGISAIKGYSVFGRYLFLADFNDPEQIYQEWGSYIFIDRKIWKEAENKDRELLAHGKEPEHVENLIKHLEHNMSFYIGYGPEPDRVYFEEKDGEPRGRRETEDTVKTPVFDSKLEAERLVFSYEDPKMRRLKNRVIMELEVAVDPRKRLEEIKSFLDNLTEFLLTTGPYMENIDWPWLLFSDKSGLLNIEEFHLLKDFRKRKTELEGLIRQINEHIGFEFNNGRNLDARKKLILNLAKLNLWHFDLSKISLFLPFMDGSVLRLLTRELLDEWYRVFSKESLETIRQFAQFFNIVSPVISEKDQLRRYSERWYKIFSRYRNHSRMFIQLLKGRYPYRGVLPLLSSGGEEPGGVRTEPDWENVEACPAMKAHDNLVNGLDAAPDGKYVVTASTDKTAKVWVRERDGYKLLQTLQHGCEVYSAQFSNDGEYIVTAGSDYTAKVWEKIGDEYRLMQTLRGHKKIVNSAQFSNDGRYIVTASSDCTAKVWERKGDEYKLMQTLEGHNDGVKSVQFSYDGTHIITASRDGTAKVWEKKVNEYEEVQTLGHGDWLTSAKFSPCGRYIVTAGWNQKAVVWIKDGKEYKNIHTLEGHGKEIFSVHFSSDGKYIVTASSDETVRVWNVATGMLVRYIDIEGSGKRAIFTSFDTEIIALLEKGDDPLGYLQIIQAGVKPVATAEPVQTEPDWEKAEARPAMKVHDDKVCDLDATDDGNYVVTANQDGTADVWVREGEGKYRKLQTLTGHKGAVLSTMFGCNGQYLVTAGHDGKARIWEWDGRKYTLLQVLRGHADLVWTVEFSYNGQYIVTGSNDHTAKVWKKDDSDGKYKEIQTLTGYSNPVTSTQFSPDMRYIVTTAWDIVKIWKWNNTEYEPFQELKAHENRINSVKFSHDGKYIVTASNDCTAKVWVKKDSDNKYEELWKLEGHNITVGSARFSSDSKFIVTTDWNTTVKVWDTATGRLIKDIEVEGKDLKALFTSYDREIVILYEEEKIPFHKKGHLQIIQAGVKPVATAEPVQTEPDWEKAEARPAMKVCGDYPGEFDITQDGEYMVTAEYGGLAKVWKREGNGYKEIQTLEEGAMVYSARFSPGDIKYIVTGTTEGATVWVKDGDEYRKLQTLMGHKDHLWEAQFSPGSEYIVTAGNDGTAIVWKRGKGKNGSEEYKLLQTLEKDIRNSITSASFSPDGNYIVTAYTNGIAKIWKKIGNKYKEIRTLRGHGDVVDLARFSPDGNYIVTASRDGTARVWLMDEDKCELLYELKGHKNDVRCAQFSPGDGKYIVTIGSDNTAKIWETSTGKLIKSINLAGDADFALFTSYDKEIAVMSVVEQKENEFEGYLQIIQAGIKPVVTAESAQTGPDWENPTLHESVKINDKYTPDLDTALDGKYLVTADEKGTVKVWLRGVDNNYTELQTIKAHEDNVCSAKFSSDGQYIITASNDETAKIWVKEGDKFQLFQILRGHTKQLQSAQFSHDGQYIVTASLDCTARVWVREEDRYKLLQTLKGHNLWVASAQFSNDGQYIITAGGDGTIKVWIKEGNKYELLQTLAGHTASMANSAQFSPDGKYFVSSGDDQTARVWVMGDSGKYTELYVLWHINWVNSAQFSNDGQYIVTACADGTARVWETVTGRMVKSIDAKNECRRALFISSDTEIIATSHLADDGCYLHVIKAGVKPMVTEPARMESDWENAQVHKGFKVKDWDVRDLDATPDGKYILTAFRTGKVILWEKGDNGKCNELQTLVEYPGWASSARFSHDLEYIVTTSRQGPIKIFKKKGDKYMPFQTIEGNESYEEAWFSPDGKTIVAQSDSKVHVFVRIKDERRYEFLQSMAGAMTKCGDEYRPIIKQARLSPDGEYIAIGHDRKLEIWGKEGSKYKLLQALEGHELYFHSKCFNSDGEYMITRLEENKLIVWKRENGKYVLLQKLDFGMGIWTAQISPDGEYIVTTSFGGICKLWMKENNKYKPLYNLEGYNEAVNETQFSSDGRYLATVGEDEPAKIWEVSTGKLLRTIKDISYDYLDGDTQSCILFTAHDMEILAVSYNYIQQGTYESEPTLFVVEAGVKPEQDRLGHIPGWMFLQEGVSEEQAPFELQKYLRYLKPEEAEFLVEREPADFHIGKEEFKIEGVELARLIVIARLMRKEVFREGLSLEELDELLKQREVKEADLSAKCTEIEQAILGQEDSFYLFLRELVQNSRDAICGGRTKSDEIDFTGFLGQGFYTLFSDFDFDEVRIKTSIGDGNIYYLTFVKEVDGKGRNIIKISNIGRRRQTEGEVENKDIPMPEEIDIRSYIPKGKKEWIVSITDPVGMDLFTIINYLLVPDNTLKRRVPVRQAKKGRYWKGTEIQRVKYFTGHENEPQLEALITYEYASLYNGAVNRKDSPIHFNRFPEEENEGVLVNEDKEKLSTVTTIEGDLTYYWCSKRGYNRLTHKDLYFHDPEDHSDPDYTEFMPQILLDELYRKGLTIDIPKGMRLIRTRNALADEQKHLLPLKKAIAVGAMKASVYLMLKHEIYLPTLPQDFFDSVTQPFDEHLAEENLETADMINKGRWNEISQERFRYLSNPENFSDLIQVIRNIKVERKDEEGRLIIQTLEEHRREILEAARSGKSFEDIEDSFKGIAEGIKARMKHGFRTAKSFHEAEDFYYKYTETDVENSPIMSLLRVLFNLLAEAMDSPGIKNSFIYSSKPELGAQGDKEMFWNLRALSHRGWIDKLIKVIDNDEDIDKDFIYEFFIWVAGQDTSHEFLHVYEHLEDRRHMRKVRDSHVSETWAKGSQAYEQKKLLKKIIKNRFHVQEVVRRLKEEFSREKRRDRFGTGEWDIDRIMKLAKGSANAFMVGEVEGEETKASIRERFKPDHVIRYRLDNGQLVIGELKTYASGEIVLDSNNNAKFDENPVPEIDGFYKLIKDQMEILYRTDPGVTLLFVKGENVLNFQGLDRLQFAKRSNHKRRRQITLPYNMLYLLECIEDKEGAFEYITTYENIRKDNMNETVSRVMELTDAKLEDADTKRMAFLELLQLGGAVEDIAGKIAEHCHGDMGIDLRLYLDEDGVLAVRNTNDTKAIFSIDSDYIEHVSLGQHKLTYWDILRNRLKGCKDTDSEIIMKGTDLAGIRQILIQVLMRRELIRRERQETDNGRSYGALSDTNLGNLGVLADENQEGKKMIAIGSTCLLTIEEGKDGKYTYSQNATGIRYVLERINQGFDVEVINEQEELIKEDHMQLVLKEIFGTQLAVTTKGAYIDRDKRDELLLLSEESSPELKSEQKDVTTIIGSRGVSFNILLTLGIYKLFYIEDKDSNMKNILLALGYTDEQADGILSSKGVIKLPPMASFTHIINTIATFTRTIDISA